MRIFYFVHITGTDIGISGIPRVVRNLARELARMSDVEFVPVCWRHDLQAIVHAEQKLLDNLSRHGGPTLTEAVEARQPVAPSSGDWLLIAEVPHLQSHLADYPPVHLDEVVGCAVQTGFKVAIVFHDILPLVFGVGGKLGQPFVELSPTDLRSRSEDAERLAFSRYAHATALVDLVFPVSRTAGDALRDWLIRHGHRAERLPPAAPVLLPEEVFGAKQVNPLDQPPPGEGRIEFVAVGFVNAQKNQLAAMAAFLRLVERRPDLDLHLHLVGLIGSDVAVPASLMVKRAKGSIVLHGRLPDGQIRELTRRSRATVFVSLAEGFGLPVAESLWRGRPCLCSNSGSVGEVARGGGCLAVDPRSIEAISAGFETLATNPEKYKELLREIAARPFKTWSRYADQLVDAFSVASSGGIPVVVEGGAPVTIYSDGVSASADDRRVDREAVLMISAADWLMRDAFSASNRTRSLFYAGAINYDAERDGAVLEETLFFGPYVPLPAGHYAFTLDGELDGELRLSLTAQDGALRIAEATVTSFDEPIVFELAHAVERFEIVGVRTPQLRSLTLRCACGELRASGTYLNVPEMPDQRVDGGASPRPPTIVSAASLRVHDAYNSARGNRLRNGAAIAFESATHGGVRETTLFFGPYIRLEAGRYSIRFVGELQGSLKLKLTRDFGRDCLRELVLTSFEAPVLVDIAGPAVAFEAVGNRTEETRTLRLESIEIALASGSAQEADDRVGTSERRARRSLLARVFGRR